jgi:hypothetical protein
MRTIATALATHLAGEVTTLATCWKVTLNDGDSSSSGTVKAFTDHDANLVIDDVTYLAASGYTASDVETQAMLNVDGLEVIGFIASPSITEQELLAGVWDYAQVEIFVVNWADPESGLIWQRFGHLGEVTLERGQFHAELRGLMQHYTATLVELTSASCRANLGDERCQVDLGPFTVTGTLTSVGDDNMTLGDTGRTEPGPTGAVAIVSITQANPGVVTLAATLDLPEDSPVTISGVQGMTMVNGTTLFANPNAGKTTFELSVDTTAYPAMTASTATVTPLGATSGYFDHGLFTATSGAADGLSMEVKSYVAGQIVLVLPMPYPLEVGDTYSMVAGCDKSFFTCRDRFDNVVNMRAEPWLPGFDAMIQVGRKQ